MYSLKDKVLLEIHNEYQNNIPNMEKAITVEKIGASYIDILYAMDKLQNEGMIENLQVKRGGQGNPIQMGWWNNIIITPLGQKEAKSLLISSDIRVDSNIPTTSNKRFRVALSFPGEHRDLVKDIADKLADVFGIENILYDHYHRAEFARPNLDTHIQKLYRDESDLIVVFICKDYNEKRWCGLEWRAIRDLLNTKQADDRIMFIKCGEGSVDGVFGTIDGYIDSNEIPVVDITNYIVSRYSAISDTNPINHNSSHDTKNKYVEQAKKMILDRYVRNRAKPDYMIMSGELLNIKFECTNPKVADAFLIAIDELKNDGFIYESGLGIHLTQQGYDSIF